ncbi:MAG: hypothetical protein HY650_06915 [Acidobacteria bacterium]|nr:hypothetical protein [Acidobacteriota bacterium]
MNLVPGAFDSQGNPVVKIAVRDIPSRSAKPFVAIIDAGFTGFLALPFHEGMNLGMRVTAVTPMRLANDVVVNVPTSEAQVTIGNELGKGICLLFENSESILVGMDFLRTFEFALLKNEAPIITRSMQCSEASIDGLK